MVDGGGAGARNGVNVGAGRGEAAGAGILEGDGFGSAEAEAVQDEFVEIGFGLGRRDVFAAGEKSEAVKEAEAREVGVAPRVRRVGRETDRERERTGVVQEREDARENRLLEHERIFDGAAFEFEVGAIGVGAEAVPRIKGVVGVAGATQEEIAIEGDAMVGVDEAVGVDEGCLGVEDETVEVEDKSADHAEGGRVERESVRVKVSESERESEIGAWRAEYGKGWAADDVAGAIRKGRKDGAGGFSAQLR